MDLQRPQPPDHLLLADPEETPLFVPAEDLERWLRGTFIDGGGALFNAEHEHLEEARIGCLWTNVRNVKAGRRLMATAEIPRAQGNRWQKCRAEQQLREWFGDPIHFLITVDAECWIEASDAAACALAEHELLHCSCKVDEFEQPRKGPDGEFLWRLRGHDVEQFVSVVRRYGAKAAGVEELVSAALAWERDPIWSAEEIEFACGTCAR